jgi:hypothetical protein
MATHFSTRHATAVAAYPEAIGSGLIFRIAKPLQREFFTVPKGKDFAAKYG